MPLFKSFLLQKAEISVWSFCELESYDAEVLLEAENYGKLENAHPRRVTELLMVRKILKEKLPNHKILYRDRQPYLYPSDFQISVTHSFPFAALALSKSRIGIDMEKISKRICKIRHKFLTAAEQSFIEEHREAEMLTAMWCIKESLYKMHHSNLYSLKENYEIAPFSLDCPKQIGCRVFNDFFSEEYTAALSFFDDYCFAAVQ